MIRRAPGSGSPDRPAGRAVDAPRPGLADTCPGSGSRVRRAGRGATDRTPPAGAAPAPATGRRSCKPAGHTISVYLPQLDSWDGHRLEAHAAVSIQASATRPADVRRRLAPGRHPDRQGRPPGDARRPAGRAGPLSLGDGQGGGVQEAPRAERTAPAPRDRTGPPRGGAGDGRGPGQGARAGPQERPASDRVLDDAGHPRPDRRLARVPPGRGHAVRAGVQYASAHAEGRGRRPLPPALRRLDDRRRRGGAVERGDAPLPRTWTR